MNGPLKWLCVVGLLGRLADLSAAAPVEPVKEKAMSIPITSSGFAEGQPIPDPHYLNPTLAEADAGAGP